METYAPLLRTHERGPIESLKLDGAPAWSNFQIANNLGATYTAGITGTF